MRSSTSYFAGALIVGIVTAGLTRDAAALPPPNTILQPGSSRSFAPARPTISPYIALRSGGQRGLGNLLFLVKPQLEQQAINRQQETRINYVERFQREVVAGNSITTDPLRDLESKNRQTGFPSWYMTHQRFFNAPTARPRP